MTRQDYRRSALPYGLWVCGDGREVLFNRRYHPIVQRLDGVVTAANPKEWVDGILRELYFYDDDTKKNAALSRRLEEILAAFHADGDVQALAQAWQRSESAAARKVRIQ